VSVEVIKTGDAAFDRRINAAMDEAKKIAEGQPEQGRETLNDVFRAVIGYRIAEHFGMEDQKKRYAGEVDRLYGLFPQMGLNEEKVAALSRRVISKIAV